MKKEIWKDVIGYEGLYQVNKLGIVKSLKRYYVPKDKILKNNINCSGYYHTSLMKDRIQKSILTHRLIAIHFIDNENNYPCINHINGIKTDNRIENLEWCTYSQNLNHAINTGLKPIKNGSGLNSNKIEEKDAIFIKFSNEKVKELSERFNISNKQIRNIQRGLSWKHI